MLQDVTTEGSGGGTAPAAELTTPAAGAAASGGSGVGIEILSSGTRTAPDTGGLPVAAPKNTGDLPPIEKAADAPDQVNDAAGKATPAAQVVKPGDKTPKPAFDKADESSSKHKPKKGIKKIIPPNPL